MGEGLWAGVVMMVRCWRLLGTRRFVIMETAHGIGGDVVRRVGSGWWMGRGEFEPIKFDRVRVGVGFEY